MARRSGFLVVNIEPNVIILQANAHKERHFYKDSSVNEMCVHSNKEKTLYLTDLTVGFEPITGK